MNKYDIFGVAGGYYTSLLLHIFIFGSLRNHCVLINSVVGGTFHVLHCAEGISSLLQKKTWFSAIENGVFLYNSHWQASDSVCYYGFNFVVFAAVWHHTFPGRTEIQETQFLACLLGFN